LVKNFHRLFGASDCAQLHVSPVNLKRTPILHAIPYLDKRVTL
jgi:hypothetical protein